MNTKVIITMLVVGAAIVLTPVLVEFISSQNTQNNIARIMIEKPGTTGVNLNGHGMDEFFRYCLFALGATIIAIGIGFAWLSRAPESNPNDLKQGGLENQKTIA